MRNNKDFLIVFAAMTVSILLCSFFVSAIRWNNLAPIFYIFFTYISLYTVAATLLRQSRIGGSQAIDMEYVGGDLKEAVFTSLYTVPLLILFTWIVKLLNLGIIGIVIFAFINAFFAYHYPSLGRALPRPLPNITLERLHIGDPVNNRATSGYARIEDIQFNDETGEATIRFGRRD